MAGRFTNLRYDKDAYDDEVSQSTNPLIYKLDPNYAVNCSPCFSPYGPRAGHDNADAIGQQIDVDSILRGINKVSSKANRNKIPDSLKPFKTYIPADCSDALESQYSRFSHPSFDIKGLNTKDMRFGYPLHDPQCQIFENSAVNTRLQAKDNHKTIWQEPFDQKNLLPTERLGKVKNCTVSLNCNYAPYS